MAPRKRPRRKANRPARKTKAVARKVARKRTKPSRRAKPAARKAVRRARPARPARSAKAAKRQPAKRPAKRTTRQASSPSPKRVQKTVTAGKRDTSPREKPVLNRIRRLLADEERMGAAGAARQGDHLSASAVTGRGAMRAERNLHTESSPTLTAGDVDARWQDAYAVGDEAPGGDNPTPDQDRVDDIGKALGIEYQDGEELKGGEEVVERDRHRWEMDPASSDDWPHDKK